MLLARFYSFNALNIQWYKCAGRHPTQDELVTTNFLRKRLKNWLLLKKVGVSPASECKNENECCSLNSS